MVVAKKPLKQPTVNRTTVRLPQALQQEIEAIKHLDATSMNHVFEEGMRYYVRMRRDRLEDQLDRALQAIRARETTAEDVDAALSRLVKAEAAMGGRDPAEGRMVDLRHPQATESAMGELAVRIQSLMTPS